MGRMLRGPTCRVGREMVRAFLISVVVSASAAGCGKSAANETGCVEGLSASCNCADGSSGIQICQPDSTFGDCTCSHAAPNGGGSAGQAGGRGPTQPAGGGGSGGTGAAGISGGGGLAGRGGGGTGTGGAAGGGGPAAGTPYSACSRSQDCGGTNAMCTTSGSQTVGYCSPRCTALINPCPAPIGGSVQASCVARACTLGSCQQADCPTGMKCDPTTFSCAYPPK